MEKTLAQRYEAYQKEWNELTVLLARVDERVETLCYNQKKMEDKLDSVELIVNTLQIKEQTHDGFWKVIGRIVFSMISSLVWVIVIIVLYKFGIHLL